MKKLFIMILCRVGWNFLKNRNKERYDFLFLLQATWNCFLIKGDVIEEKKNL